ncbi:hypothetical protein K450DRAFT_244264 [Umbelopsis ramanniana AG]|uniref:SLA1 homology domain-containing protein n=1 Tax=Umbelopsis ramanniana AG TaxID=1314678 RepID=A0AAD5EB22_UMBRA|nr:uncharacterized protein K450DRAFT_244264 [Umbelopsis ramanniana AG]KAI8578950.1 hypothetical protein K450DRAFT_244264 [Umbelopsis ramanniana AG]
MSSEVRSWRGIDGKFAAQASFGGLFQNTKVKLIKPHGGIVAIPLDRLCPEDQNYVRQTAQISTTSSKVEKPRSHIPPQPPSQPQPEKNSNGHIRQPDKSTILAYARLDNKSSPGLASFLRETATSQSPFSLQKKSVPPTPISFSPASDVNLIAAVDRLAVSPTTKQVPKLPAKSMSRKSSIISKTGSAESRSYAPVANPLYKKKIHLKESSLEAMPLPILTRICEYLDVRSVIYLMARISKNLIAVLDTPQAKAFGVISFLPHYQYLIDHRFVLALASFLKRHNFLHTVHTIIYDSTKIQELTVMYTFEHFTGLRHISLQKCWDVHSYPLANLLARRNAARGQERIRIPHLRSVEFGSILRRGDVPGAFLVVKSETYGQDIGLIGLSLRGLAGHDIKFDTYLCGACDRGHAKPMFDCTFCGPVVLKKCSSCAPQCERCHTRACGQATCNASYKLDTSDTCGRCQEVYPVCNQPSCPGNRSGPICQKCNSNYHERCQSDEGGQLRSNICSRCGLLSCPRDDLILCIGGCRAQWCVSRGCAHESGLDKCMCGSGRSVCRRCRITCKKCGRHDFCGICLRRHAAKCY